MRSEVVPIEMKGNAVNCFRTTFVLLFEVNCVCDTALLLRYVLVSYMCMYDCT